ncbi:transcriptional regulator Kaiso isoform X3 [Equus asinus]|uniref:transcriptional regulator Kaiso isoform X3 n=1 Tax=Equus asinus TaxID=9793 RepID=UPI0038F67B5D
MTDHKIHFTEWPYQQHTQGCLSFRCSLAEHAWSFPVFLRPLAEGAEGRVGRRSGAAGARALPERAELRSEEEGAFDFSASPPRCALCRRRRAAVAAVAAAASTSTKTGATFKEGAESPWSPASCCWKAPTLLRGPTRRSGGAGKQVTH